MKKITLGVITCTLISCSNSFGMLRHVVRTHTYARRCHTKPAFKLPSKNIFNAFNSNEPKETLSQLKDLFDRNHNLIRAFRDQINTLKLQNNIASQHNPFLGYALDIKELKSLEKELQLFSKNSHNNM